MTCPSVHARQPAARTLIPTATATLDQLTNAAQQHLARGAAYLAAHGVQSDDHHVYEHAAALAAGRSAALLAAKQPDWLSNLFGGRPLDRPAATQVWDDAVRDLATRRLRHGITDPAASTGPDADATGRVVWEAVSPTVATARVWLDTYTTNPALPPVRTRSLGELHARRVELDVIFADAPADHRQLIELL